MRRCKASWKAPTALATLPTVTGQGRRKILKSEGARWANINPRPFEGKCLASILSKDPKISV